MFLNNRVLCLIPARGGSKGIKFKNLQKIGKKSLVQISIDFAKSIKFLDKIVVSSDNNKILNIAKNSGVYSHLRPNRLFVLVARFDLPQPLSKMACAIIIEGKRWCLRADNKAEGAIFLINAPR